MARKPRFSIPGVPQHIIQRGNNRDPCFFGEVDYSYYLEQLQEASGKNQAIIHAFVLMTNHVLCGAPHKTCYVKLEIM